MTKNSKLIIGVVTAAAAGAIIGMLFAPKKGSKLRNKVRNTANDLTSDLLDVIQRGRQQFTQVGEDVLEKVQGLKSKAEEDVKINGVDKMKEHA